MSAARPTVIVLAAGLGRRYRTSGGATHKLQALLDGVPVLEHVLRSVRASGLPWHIVQPLPGVLAEGQGMGDSLARGVRATVNAPGWLVLPGDLPLVQPDTLCQVAQALQQQPVAQAHCQGQPGHPVGFAAACRTELMALHGDQGAASVQRAYRARGQWQAVEVGDAGIHTDIDTVQDLARAQAALQQMRTT